MPGKEKTTNSENEIRRRNPSRCGKTSVGDIAEVFKKQMASPSATMSPVSEKSVAGKKTRAKNATKDKEHEHPPNAKRRC